MYMIVDNKLQLMHVSPRGGAHQSRDVTPSDSELDDEDDGDIEEADDDVRTISIVSIVMT